MALAHLAACVLYAAAHYGIPPALLSSVVAVEGGGRGIVRHNTDGSEDLGWAQINTVWLPQLRQYGIGREELLREPCINVGIAAWILRGDYLRCGGVWRGALSAYNTGRCRSYRGIRYAEKVLRHLRLGATE